MRKLLALFLAVSLISLTGLAQEEEEVLDLSNKTIEELTQMLEDGENELEALVELGDRRAVDAEHVLLYTKPYEADKWNPEIVEEMKWYFNSIDWYGWSGGDPEKVAEVCMQILMTVPVTSDTGPFLSIVKDKKTLME